MERKIGEIFEYKGEWYQCVEDTEDISCVNCCFYNGGHKLCTDEDMGDCVKEYRSDAKSICFKKLEKVGEPYIVYDYSRNEVVTVQDYKLYKIRGACYNGPHTLCFCPYGKIEVIVRSEIKQNKEDMEEKKLNLKPFDIQKAREGKPVCTRDGRKARIICFDYKGDCNAYPILALISTINLSGVPSEIIAKYTEDGRYAKYNNVENDEDLMMLPEKKEMYINIYKSTTNYIPGGSLYDTEEAAKAGADMADDDYITTTKVSWEE